MMDKQELTAKQIEARKRLRSQALNLIGEARAQAGDEGLQWDPFPQDPDGPPWNYDLTPDEREAKQQKKQRWAEKRQKVKNTALDKTPESLKNPSSFQVRFRTGLIYILLTVACVMLGEIPTLLYLMVVAGICAGEFYFILRQDAKLPNEALGIAGAVLYLPATYLWGLVGAMLVSILLLLTLLIWYVFWLRARVPDVGVSFFGAAYTGLLLCGLIVIRQSIGGIWGGLGAAGFVYQCLGK